MASRRNTIGSVLLTPTPMPVIRAHAERLAYLGDASKIRAYLIREYGDPSRVPSLRFIKEMLDQRRSRRSPETAGNLRHG